jgi:hypothetical protein
MYGYRKKVTAAAILKAIRDGKAKDLDTLATALADRLPAYVGTTQVGDTPRSVLMRSIEVLVSRLYSVDAIEIDDRGHFTFKEEWDETHFFPVNGIGLSNLDRLAQSGSLAVRPLFAPNESVERTPDIFIVAPFEKSFKPIHDCIKRTAGRLSLSARLAEDFFTAHSVMGDVWNAIMNTQVVIADCTTKNPNVFYEIGIAHTIGKPVILITRRKQDVPFDVEGMRYIKYTSSDSGIRKLESQLAATLRNILGLDVSAADS